MDKKMLKSKMVLFGDTQADLADAIGISLSRLNAKINEKNGAEFLQSEISVICERYKLSVQETANIFFAEKVS